MNACTCTCIYLYNLVSQYLWLGLQVTGVWPGGNGRHLPSSESRDSRIRQAWPGHWRTSVWPGGMEETFLPLRAGIQELGSFCMLVCHAPRHRQLVGPYSKGRDHSLFRRYLVLRTRPANQALSSCQLATGTLDGMSRAKTDNWGITACY